MKIKDKIKSYSFWVSLTSAIILILKLLGSRFGFSIDETMISDLFTALCSILVLLGIIVVPNSNQTNNSINNKTTEENTICQTSSLNSQTTIETNVEENETAELCKEQYTNEDCTTECDALKIQSEDNQLYLEEPNNEEKLEVTTNTQSENIINNNSCTFLQETNIINEPEFTPTQVNKSEETQTSVSNLKVTLSLEKEKFAGNLDAYIFELQEEIRKTREGM